MERLESTLDSAALGRARALLKAPLPSASLWPPTLAAALAALSALALAVTVILGPPVLSGAPSDVGLRHAVHERY